MSSTPPQVQSVRTQMDALRNKLLDLSMRNRMLNYRPSKRIGVTIVGENSFHLHRLLVEEGKKLTFVGRAEPQQSVSPRPVSLFDHDDSVAMAEFRRQAQDELDAYLETPGVPVEMLDSKLNTTDSEPVMQAKLRMIAREATLAKEELGINTLFITLGTLEWSEDNDRSYRAPLIFIPVALERLSNGSLKLVHDGSDVGTNLPLRAKLQEFNLKLPDLEDEKNLVDYFGEIASTIRSRGNWQVHPDEVCLGFFNYEKYSMYVDLGGDAWPETVKPWNNPDLLAMLGGGYSSPDSPIGDATQLDEVRTVETAQEVFDADGSQVIAMIRAAAGLSIVVEGPPGTGKSQTITNIIAEAVAAGKSVLFVSAKRAALEVVKRNLERADLGSMCLDLHDKLTNRREFYAEIKRTVSRSLSLKSEEARVARLTELRDRLNAHCEAVNTPLGEFEASPFQAMSMLATLDPEAPEDREGRISFESLRFMKESEVKIATPLVNALQSRLQQIGVPVEHPFWGTAIDYLDPSTKLDLREDLASAASQLERASRAMTDAITALKIQVPLTAANVRTLRLCVDQALHAPPHDGVTVQIAAWREGQGAIREVIDALRTRQGIRANREPQVRSEIWESDLLLIQDAYDRYAAAWYKPIIGAYRSARRSLDVYLSDRSLTDPIARRDLVDDIQRSKVADRLIDSKGDLLRRLVGAQWVGVNTDPGVLDRLLVWILALDSKVSSGEIPPGFVDFFAAKHDSQQVAELAQTAENEVGKALGRYAVAADLLRFNRDEMDDEELNSLSQRIERWQSNLDRLPEYIAFSEARRHVEGKRLKALLEVADQWGLASDRLVATFLRSYYSGVVREAMQKRPELKVFERAGHEASIQEFRGLDDFKLKYNRAQVRLSHQKRMPSFDNALGNLHQLKMQCELQRSHKPIRWIMSRSGEAIQRIKPVFMMSPLSVAIHLPPELPPFDMVIFDEASQVRPEDSLCAIVRAKQCIVVGDTRQMPPTSFFERLADDEDDFEENLEDEVGTEARKLESVLSLMSAVTLGQIRRPDLRWHYRSIHPSLIQPSNEMFYDNRLIVFPSPGTDFQGQKIGVVFHHHPETVYEAGAKNRVNRKEAEIVADQVVRHVTETPEQSLLVAAMNRPQADLIYSEVQKRERLNPVPFRRYAELHPHEPLDVKNLENVQGDERDVIFISITYGRDASGTLRQQFGPLLVEGGERRLNVLITRARKRCEVFSNITADDISLSTGRPGVQALKRYLRFAKDGITDIPIETGLEEESPFEEEVCSALRDRGFIVHPQVGTEGYRIDIGIIDPDHPGRYLLGVECDGATYHRARTARDRDKLRQRVLESRGWTLHRIWSHDWWQDREGEIRRMLAAIESTKVPDDAPEMKPLDSTPSPEVEEIERGETPSVATRPYVVAPPASDVKTEPDLGNYMIQVVSTEGPIHRDLLFTRLREATGYSRAGSNLKEKLDRVMWINEPRLKRSLDSFYINETQIAVPRDWSSRPSSEKKTELIPDVELSAALRAIVERSFGVTKAEACKAAYALLGFKRVNEAATERALKIAGSMVQSKQLHQRPDGLLAVD